MKKVSSIMWGLVFIAVGIILGGNALGWFNIDLFFDGWWTLFIIVPCTISLITEKDRVASLVGVIIGVYLLLACQDVIEFDLLWKMILPIVVILIGVSIICKTLFTGKFDKAVAGLNEKFNSDEESATVFGGANIDMAGKEFKGKNVKAIFGGLKLDLRKAKIKEDVIINATAVFGGIEIFVPDDIIVEIKSSSAFGGVDDKRKSIPKDGAPTIYVSGVAVFGGVEIK